MLSKICGKRGVIQAAARHVLVAYLVIVVATVTKCLRQVFVFEKASFLVILRALSLGWGMDLISRFPAVTEEDKKYMKQCCKCGAWSPLASEACTTCGGKEFWGYKAPKEKKARRDSSRTTESPAETRKVCQTCGTSNPEYVKNYCVRCGARL